MSIKILRLACTFKPVSVSIEYTENGGEKKYRQFPVVFSSFTQPNALYETLISEYPTYFNEQSILPNKLKNFTKMIIEKSPSVDLRNVSKEELDKYKSVMNREFEMNAIKPGDPDFVYDMQVDLGEANEECDWDE